MVNSSIGSLALIGTLGALGGSGDFHLIHLSQLAICLSISFSIPGQPTRWRMRSIVLSRKDIQLHCGTLAAHDVQMNLAEPIRASLCLQQSAFCAGNHLVAPSDLLSRNIQVSSGLSSLSWSSDWRRPGRSSTEPELNKVPRVRINKFFKMD